MKFALRHSTLCLAALALGMVAFPTIAAADPPAVKPAPPADTKATPIRFTLQLLRVEERVDLVGIYGPDRLYTPAPSQYGSVKSVVTEFVTTPTEQYVASPGYRAAQPARMIKGDILRVEQVNTKKQKTLASPIMTTLDGSTATIAVTGDDLSYTISLSPAIAANGKILTLWNLRLTGKSLPGATAVTATGATKIDAGKPAIIAEVSLTDPANAHRATFILQGTTLTGDAAIDTAPPALPTPVTPPTVAPTITTTPATPQE